MRKIAFYSYKGGTGRTLLVANTANFLAQQGQNVVLIDLDLEAPGLIKKFGEDAKEGFIDYLYAFLKKSRNIKLKDYIVSINENIHIIPAGNPNHSSYPTKLAHINWHRLLEKKIIFSNNTLADSFFKTLILDIENFFPNVDYILFDCRTGITTIGDIVLNDLSDEIVCLFLNNEENFDGISRIIKTSSERKKTIYLVVSRFPTNLSYEDENRKLSYINNELIKRIDKNFKLPKLNVFHSDIGIEFFEQLKYSDEKILKHSILLQDYLFFFQNIFSNIINQSVYSRFINIVEKRKKLPSLKNNTSTKPFNFIENDNERKEYFKNNLNFQFQVVGAKYFKKEKILNFTNEIVENIKGELDINPKNIKKNINWNLLGFQFSDEALDFCKDLYFLNETRKNIVDIMQIGFLKSFEIIVPSQSKIINAYNSENSVKYLESFFKYFDGNTIYKYYVMGDQTAASECYRSFSKIELSDSSTLYENISTEMNEKDIASKLQINNLNNIAIVDHVTANNIFEMISAKEKYKRLNFFFTKDIPVGFLYRKNCPNIRYEINKAIHKILLNNNPEEYWESIIEELKKEFNIDAFTWDEFKINIFWDLKLRDAIEWYKQTNINYENSTK